LPSADIAAPMFAVRSAEPQVWYPQFALVAHGSQCVPRDGADFNRHTPHVLLLSGSKWLAKHSLDEWRDLADAD
jgi:hypothetical protein